MSHRADCSAALGRVSQMGASPCAATMTCVRSDACAKVHAQEGLWHVLRSVAQVSASVSLHGSISKQELKVGGKETNPGIFIHV